MKVLLSQHNGNWKAQSYQWTTRKSQKIFLRMRKQSSWSFHDHWHNTIQVVLSIRHYWTLIFRMWSYSWWSKKVEEHGFTNGINCFNILTIRIFLKKKKNLLVEPVWCCCTVGHITAFDSRHDNDVMSSSRIREENNSHPCAQRTLHPFCVVSHSCMVAEPVFLELGYWFIPGISELGYRVAMASTQEVEMLRRQLDELTAQMIEVRQQSSSTAMNAAVSGLAEAVRTMGQSVSKPRPEEMRVGKPVPYAPGKDFDDWDFTFNGNAGTLDPAYPALLKTARQSPTVVMATPPHEQQSATLPDLLTMLTQKRARKVVRIAGNNGFEAYRQLCLMYGTSVGSKSENVEDHLNEFLALVGRYDEANGTDPVPDQVKKACIISNTPEPLKTHLQLNVAKLGNFNESCVATEDYLRSRRIFKTNSAGNTHDEDSMEVDAVSRKEKGKEKSGKVW